MSRLNIHLEKNYIIVETDSTTLDHFDK